MSNFPLFLSLVFVVRDQADQLEEILARASICLSGLVSDHELIIIDNASSDRSVALLKQLTKPTGLPNLQVFALTKEVDVDTAIWVGLESALGDFVAVMDPIADDVSFLGEMLEQSTTGADVVFAQNSTPPAEGLFYGIARRAFNRIYKWLNGVDLINEAPQCRLLSKRVVNFILQHPRPAVTYRHLPASGGFAKINLRYNALPRSTRPKKLSESIDLGMRLLVSTTRVPMRLVTGLSVFGALGNLLYSFYVLAIWMWKPDVAPGWVSLSLVQSGMFFLLSLVLLVLGEYILHTASLSSEGPLFHVGQEFTSARMTRRERLNIEELTTVVNRTPSS
jgi:hypothetical protein